MISIAKSASCSSCPMRGVCMPADLEPVQFSQVDQLVVRRIKIKQGEALYRDGDEFHSLSTVRSGFFKTSLVAETGHEQVVGFHMSGEMMGLDGIVTSRHLGDAVALEDSEVCSIPYARVSELSREIPALQHHLHKAMSREIVREHQMMLLLGSMKAQERLAAFLGSLVNRLRERGFSSTELILRMTRAEIGSYLGLTLETVSRAFSSLTRLGALAVHQRHIRIQDADLLKGILPQQPI